MQSVYKYKVPHTLGSISIIKMPVKAKILCAQLQKGEICIWALIDTSMQFYEDRKFILLGTGHEFTEKHTNYIATFQFVEGTIINHLFEVLS